MTDTTAILATLRRELTVEPEWAVDFRNGFQWWPGNLAQRIWIADGESRRLHIETDFLRNLPEDDKQLERVAYGNRFATLSALILSPEDRSLRLHASLLLAEEGSAEINRLAFLTAAMQAADASSKFPGLSEFFSAEPDSTSHPTSGTRALGSGILLTLEALRAENDEAGSLGDMDFSPLEEWRPRPWVMGFAGKGGLTGEFAFSGNQPAVLAAAAGDVSRGLQTAMLQFTTDFEHPQLRHGLLSRLTLPVNGTAEDANRLNLAEARGPVAHQAHQLGAWCVSGDNLVFATFIPTVLFNQNLVEALVYGAAHRSLWANAVLFPDEAAAGS